jgi:LysM repeat protein
MTGATHTADTTTTTGTTHTTDVVDTGHVASPVTYTVKPGDTLSAIALRFGSSVKSIADANHIPDPNRISVGQVLVIPK